MTLFCPSVIGKHILQVSLYTAPGKSLREHLTSVNFKASLEEVALWFFGRHMKKYGNTQSMSNTKQASYASLLSTCETCPFAKFWNIASLGFWIDTLQHSQMLPSGPDHSWQSRSVQRDATNREKTAAFSDCFSIQNWMALAFDLQQIIPPCYASFALKTRLEPTKWYPRKCFSLHNPSSTFASGVALLSK